MLRKEITFTDFNGNERTEAYYFNYSEPELMKMDMHGEGGMISNIKKVMYNNELNPREIIAIFDEIVEGAYGIQTPDGLRFIKDPEEIKAAGGLTYKQFQETPAYTKLFMELFGEEGTTMADFLMQVIPQTVSSKPEFQNQVKEVNEGKVDVKSILSKV